MEYEIQDQGENVLMDESTNPSLQGDDQPVKGAPIRGAHADKLDKRRLQKGELIPEEEELLQPS